MGLKLQSSFSRSIPVDGEDVDILIARLKPEEGLAFMREHERISELFSEVRDKEDRNLTPEDEARMRAHCSNAIGKFVTLPGDQITLDNEPITTGDGLYAVLFHQLPLIFLLAGLIYFENRFTEGEKKERLKQQAQILEDLGKKQDDAKPQNDETSDQD